MPDEDTTPEAPTATHGLDAPEAPRVPSHADTNAPSLRHYPTGWWLYWNEDTDEPNCVHVGPVLAAAWIAQFGLPRVPS